jgi:hypothetical protein
MDNTYPAADSIGKAPWRADSQDEPEGEWARCPYVHTSGDRCTLHEDHGGAHELC